MERNAVLSLSFIALYLLSRQTSTPDGNGNHLQLLDSFVIALEVSRRDPGPIKVFHVANGPIRLGSGIGIALTSPGTTFFRDMTYFTFL